MLALLLLGDFAQEAADGKRISGFLTLAEAQLKVENAAVRGVVAEGRAVDGFAIESPAKECRYFAASGGLEELFK